MLLEVWSHYLLGDLLLICHAGGSMCMDLLTADGEWSPYFYHSFSYLRLVQVGFHRTGKLISVN